MANFTPEQGIALLMSEGASPQAATYLVSHMGGESNGNPRAHNPVGPDDSYGLWQINMKGAMGPERMRKWGLRSVEDLYDPRTNARAAISLYNDWQKRGGVSPWKGSDRFVDPAYTARGAAAAKAYGSGATPAAVTAQATPAGPAAPGSPDAMRAALAPASSGADPVALGVASSPVSMLAQQFQTQQQQAQQAEQIRQAKLRALLTGQGGLSAMFY